MNDDVFALWVYLARTPLLWLTVTILAYCLCDRVSAMLHRAPLANPVLLTAAVVAESVPEAALKFSVTPVTPGTNNAPLS